MVNLFLLFIDLLLFLIYSQTITVWREEAAKEGLELYLVRFESMDERRKIYVGF